MEKKQSSLGIISLIMGVLSILFAFVFIGIIPGIIGVILAIITLVDKSKKHGLAIAGIVCSGIGIAIFVGMLLLIMLFDSEQTTHNSDSQNNAAIEQEQETGTNKENADNSEVGVEILKEYTLSDGIGWYTRHFMIVRNNSNETVEISTSSLAYDKDGNILGAEDASFDALGAGCTSVMYEAFDVEGDVAYYETTLNTSSNRYYESVIQDLSYVQNDIENGAVFQVTNNGEKAAEFVEGYALFFKGDQLVAFDNTYFTDDDSEIKPGATISKQLDVYEEFDRIEFYLTGRR